MGKTKPMPVRQAQIPMSEDEKRAKILQFLQQKRETFAVNILCNMMRGAITNKDATNLDCKAMVDLSVEMADHMMEKLYPGSKEEK